MTKIRATVIIEYKINPEYYPECETDEERLAIDKIDAEDDPQEFFFLENNSDKKIHLEIIEEE